MRLTINNLKKTYKISSENIINALNNISLDINEGEFCAVVGPSGSGKTTLFNILGCIDNPTDGEIYFENTNITSLKEKELIQVRNKKIGYVFQFFNLIPTLTAFENAALPFWAESRTRRKEFTTHLENIFRELNIFDLRNRYPKHLSGGQEQRIAIARSLANFPKLVLADEPTGNLDSKTALEIINLMKKQNEENRTTFIVATHDMSLLHHFDRVIYLKDGEVEKQQLRS